MQATPLTEIRLIGSVTKAELTISSCFVEINVHHLFSKEKRTQIPHHFHHKFNNQSQPWLLLTANS